MVPPNVSITLKPDTFLVDSSGTTAQIEAAASNQQTYLLRLVLENGTWLIYYAEAQ